MNMLQKESELNEIVQLVGPDALPEEDKLILDTTKSIREDFLQQNAFHEVDTYCDTEKQFLMMDCILAFHDSAHKRLESGKKVAKMVTVPVKERIARMKYAEDYKKEAEQIKKDIESQLKKV